MNKIENLIDRICPNGVQYKPITDVATIKRGVRVVKVQLANQGEIPVYQNSVTPMGYYSVSNCPANTPFIIGAGAAGEIGYSFVDFWAADDCFFFVCSKTLDSRYLYHALLCQQRFLLSKVRKASIPRLSRTIIEKLIIPVPPLPVQQEIVRILDSFTQLTAELTAELTARRKQYEYYRSNLLTQCNAPYVELRQVVQKSCSGATPAKGRSEYYENGTIPWLRTQDVRFNQITEATSYITEKAVAETAAKWIPENCVIVAISGASAGRCAINKLRATTNQHCLNLEIDPKKALYKFVFYCVASEYEELLSKKQGARGDLNSSLILSLKIPLPSIEEQTRIVSILDRFDALCNDLTSGLPAEIEARRKQYEYYRGKLLTF